MIGWFYHLLEVASRNRAESSESEEVRGSKELRGSKEKELSESQEDSLAKEEEQRAREIIQVQKAYSSQFMLPGKPSTASYSYQSLSLWLQCIQRARRDPSSEQSCHASSLRSPSTLSRSARELFNALVLDTLLYKEDITQELFSHFSVEEGGRHVVVEYLTEWLQELDIVSGNSSELSFVDLTDAVVGRLCTRLASILPLPLRQDEEGSYGDGRSLTEALRSSILQSLSPGHSLLLYRLLHIHYQQQSQRDTDVLLLRQIRCVTVLSMAVKYISRRRMTRSSQISIQNVLDNTIQYYLSYLTIPVEYIKFDTLEQSLQRPSLTSRSTDYDNWERLLDVAVHPTNNYLSLLSFFLPSSLFYTIFIQIVVNRLTKLTQADFIYLLHVLSFLPVARQYAFARFCWRV